MEKLSVYIITKEGKSHLKEVIDSLKGIADEVVVVASAPISSVHKRAKIFLHPFKDYCSQKRFAEGKCTNKWLLNLDDDEVLSPELAKEIKDFMQNPVADACKLKIGDMFPGYTKPRKWGRTYNIVRMYDRTKAQMADNLTADRPEFTIPNPSIHQFKGVVKHYSFQSLSGLINKMNGFTNMIVANMLKKDKKYCPLRIYIEFPTQFLKYYFLKRYIFNGYYGFLVSVIYAFFRVIRLAKYREALNKK